MAPLPLCHAIRVLTAAIATVMVRSAFAQSTVADSTLATTLIRESAAAARTLRPSDSLRVGLLLKVARAQISAGDVDGAMRVASDVGVWRRRIDTDATCRLLEDRRFDDAHAFVRRLPVEDRNWALAHLASQLGRPSRSARRPLDTVDTAALTRRAFGIVREVRSPQPRVDALVSIASSALRRKDTVAATEALDGALAQLRRVRDADFVSSRRLVITGELGRVGRTEAALRLSRSLEARDRLDLAWYIPSWRDVKSPRVRAELDRLVPLLETVRDPRARDQASAGVVSALRSLGDSAAATALTTRMGYVDPTTGRPWRWNDVSPTVVDRAVAVATTNVALAIAMVDSVDDPLRIGRRAQAYLSLAVRLGSTRRDTVALLLRRARQAALDARLTTERRDETLWPIASEQVGRGFFDDAIATIDAIVDPGTAASALGDLSPRTLAVEQRRERRRFIARLANAEVRIQATAGIVGQTLQLFKRSDADVAYATALADSIPPGEARERAMIAIAHHALGRRDTSAARSRLLPLLTNHRVVPRDADRDWQHDELIFALVSAGAINEAVTWARARPNAAERAAALLDAATAIQARSNVGEPRYISHGAHACRGGF